MGRKEPFLEISIDREDYGNYNKSGKYGLVAQLGAHRIRIAGVGSSNLLESTKKEDHLSGWSSFLVDLKRRFEDHKCNMPVAYCCNQFANWLLL